jgi:xanthine dehydrogenase accessory factor
MKELLQDIESWRAQGERVCVATVIATRRSAPRPVGSSFAISETGELAGSVSGGCVESEIYHEAQEVFRDGRPKVLSYGIADEEGWEIGLPCGGEIDVFLERLR